MEWPRQSKGGFLLISEAAEGLEAMGAAYESEIDALATSQGYWHEITMFLVAAQK